MKFALAMENVFVIGIFPDIDVIALIVTRYVHRTEEIVIATGHVFAR